jgi:hypothetical protein
VNVDTKEQSKAVGAHTFNKEARKLKKRSLPEN